LSSQIGIGIGIEIGIAKQCQNDVSWIDFDPDPDFDPDCG